MDRKKIIYIGSLLIITAIISIASFSYAIWSRTDEQHGKINIVAGTLNYELLSSDLNNNSITVPANTNKTIEIEITSLNNIESKYELYYTTNNENISIGYSEETVDNPTGTISSRSSKKVTVIIKNRTNSSATITFGCQGGFSDKELVLAQGNSLNVQMGSCPYDSGEVWDFPYNGTTGADGSIQNFDVPCDGYYKLEVWGAQGGTAYSSYSTGGVGGYSQGSILLSDTDTLYIGVGGTGTANNNSLTQGALGGYNGGGSTGYNPNTSIGQIWTAGGGGATHIALNNNRGTLSGYVNNTDDILIVSGGGGAGHFHNNYTYHSHGNGGPGGGYTGASGMSYGNYTPGSGGTQSLGGTGITDGTFGQGGSSSGGGQLGTNTASGGGGGYYGGGSSVYSGAGGGSGYLKSTLSNKGMYCYDCIEDLTNASTFTVKTNGTSSYRDTTNCPNGYSNDPISKCAKGSNGYAKITYLGEGNVTTLYSAAVDEVYYYDSNNNKQVIGTTDSTGKLENAFIPVGTTLYSSVAKDLTDSTQPYSKTFTNIGSETYLMPEKSLYWYGNFCRNLPTGGTEIVSTANDWDSVYTTGTYTIQEPTLLTNMVRGVSSSGKYCSGIGTPNKINVEYSKIGLVTKNITGAWGAASAYKDVMKNELGVFSTLTANTTQTYPFSQTNCYLTIHTDNNRVFELEAWWLE